MKGNVSKSKGFKGDKGEPGKDGYLKEEVDNKFNNYILAPTTANVGQTIVVKEVDKNGKPISWEAVDVSGGNTEWELISDVDTTEEVGEILLTTDMNGNTFELGDVCAHVIIPMHDSAITPLFCFIEVDGYEAEMSTTTDGNHTELVISRKDDKAMIKLEQYKYSSLKTTTINPRSFPVGNLVYYHNIKEFKAYLYGNEVFPKGTRVRLYGKRV